MFNLRRWEERGTEIGRDLGFRRTGNLFCARDEADVAKWEKVGQISARAGLPERNC